MIWKYFSRQIIEIEEKPGLYWYGFCLLFVHFLTSLFWFYRNALDSLSPGAISYCWPFFPSCDLFKMEFFPIIKIFFFIYIAGSVLSLFLSFRSAKHLWICLFTLEAIKIFISFLDYQFMGNYHFMPHIITLVFLFVRDKRFWISLWLITFYVAAASLKFNFEWLSGASLSWRIPFGDDRFLLWGAFLVPSLELVCPLMCIQKEEWIRRLGLGMLLLFHLISYYWVGFFYPAVMTSILGLWIFSPVRFDYKQIFESARKIGTRSIPILIIWVVFIIAQIGAMISPEKHSLYGASRMLSLNMFDARSVCLGFYVIKTGKERVEVAFKNENLPVRVHCDDLFFLSQAKRLCQTREFPQTTIEAYLIARPASALTYSQIVQDQNVCTRWESK